LVFSSQAYDDDIPALATGLVRYTAEEIVRILLDTSSLIKDQFANASHYVLRN